MPSPKQASGLLARLKKEALAANSPNPVLRTRHEAMTAQYRERSYPGDNYTFVGESYYVQSKPLTKAFENRRVQCLDGLFAASAKPIPAKSLKTPKPTADPSCWTTVEKALKYKGFKEILSRFEYELLQHLPKGSLLGPAYDKKGHPIPQAFAIWRDQPLHLPSPESRPARSPAASNTPKRKSSGSGTPKVTTKPPASSKPNQRGRELVGASSSSSPRQRTTAARSTTGPAVARKTTPAPKSK